MASGLLQRIDRILFSIGQVRGSINTSLYFVFKSNGSVSWMSDTSSISGLSGISNISSRTFVCEESSLVLEVLETDRHHYYLVPVQVRP